MIAVNEELAVRRNPEYRKLVDEKVRHHESGAATHSEITKTASKETSGEAEGQ